MERSITGTESSGNCASNSQGLWRTMGQAVESSHSHVGHPCSHDSFSATWPCRCAEAPAYWTPRDRESPRFNFVHLFSKRKYTDETPTPQRLSARGSREGGSTFRGLESQRLAVEVVGGGGRGSRITY